MRRYRFRQESWSHLRPPEEDNAMELLMKFLMGALWWWGIMSVADSDFAALPGSEYVFALALGSMCAAAVSVWGKHHD